MVDIDKILKELQVLPEYDNQVMLQTVEGQSDPFYGIGRLANWNHTEDEFIHPVFNIPYTNSILKELKMFRTRVMRMNPHHFYSYHVYDDHYHQQQHQQHQQQQQHQH